ncbi:MAG: YpsA SLOG family protein, partial [Thermaurantiacus tibetensis]
QKRREEEARRDGLLVLDARVGVLERQHDEALAERLLVLGRDGASSPGTALAVAHAQALGRPVIAVRLGSPGAEAEVADALAAGGSLNVAGPRESEAPGIFAEALALLEAARRRKAPGA